MKQFKKILRGLLLGLATLLLFVLIQYLWKGSPSQLQEPATREIIAHRGVHHNYQKGVYDPITGCEAKHIFPPTHAYFGNTLASIEAAFANGATLVEIDIRKSADRQLMIYHDDRLDCRTNGTGPVAEQTVEALQQLDIGHGYTADGGQTYPLRGKGIGLMPTLIEVLDSFPNKVFMIDHKDVDTESTEILIKTLQQYPPEQRSRIYMWSHPRWIQQVQEACPEVQPLFLSRRQIKDHFLPFFLTFGFRSVPAEFEGRIMAIPAPYTKYLWGWPYRFIDAVHGTGLKFYLMIDSKEDFEKLKHIPVDGYVTDYVEVLGDVMGRK